MRIAVCRVHLAAAAAVVEMAVTARNKMSYRDSHDKKP